MTAAPDAAADIVEYILGDTAPIEISVVSEKTGLAYNLVNAQDAWFSLKASPDDADSAALLTKRLGAGISIVDPTGSTNAGTASLVDIFPTATESAALTPDTTYAADLRLKTASGYLITVLFFVRATQRITRSAA